MQKLYPDQYASIQSKKADPNADADALKKGESEQTPMLHKKD
jgi:hypothetical protein